MSIGSVGLQPLALPTTVSQVKHHHHKHKEGTPVTNLDPATTNSALGPATTNTDKALSSNQQILPAASTPVPQPGLGTLVDKKA